MPGTQDHKPFANFAHPLCAPTDLRRKVTAAYRIREQDALAPLLEAARLPADTRAKIAGTATDLVARLRAKGQRGGVEGLVKEYSLSSEEGTALMCLAEALLRVPDNATRDALIRDKIGRGDWRAHLGDDRSLFVNAATWGLVMSGALVKPAGEETLIASLTGLIKRAGEPVIRSGVNMAMEMMGEQFVTGENIAEALLRAREQQAKGFSYSYDMLGEAAMTMDDADQYFADYEHAIRAIGKASPDSSIYEGPGISIKLSALHPRYERAQAERVMTELLPKVRELALLSKRLDIGFNIDAEEADRLELSLEILEALALDPELADWQGLGFVVQAYGKRCSAVIDWIVDLARRSGHRIMVRLVKGAYWDSEIKRAQVDGLADYPVFTRKVHTDISYIASARKLLDAREYVFPQFATHNAQTLATIVHLAGEDFSVGDYEFQCLHGMGEALYEEVVSLEKLGRPCRIYAPVGTHEKLLAYLVRRLLENGANSSFVNRIWDEDIAPHQLCADPLEEALAIQPAGSPHPVIKLPEELYPERRNSKGLDLSDEDRLREFSSHLSKSAAERWTAAPMIPGLSAAHEMQPIRNPGWHDDIVGRAAFALPADTELAVQNAVTAFETWSKSDTETRALCLEKAADLLEARMQGLLGLIMREAGKSAPNAIAELREAADFLRYYAQQARACLAGATPLGPLVCISPWNFPLAIFLGQVAAGLVTGNTVLAKPAEETPLIAAEAVAILHEAGVPPRALQLVTGAGDVGAALVGAPQVCGVLFTGSTDTAKLIQRQLASRVLPDPARNAPGAGSPIPFIAETGGQNAMIVDSSALPEQVVRDVIDSAFDSAGQRCSALRILCLQEEIADDILTMLRGALSELKVSATDTLCTDIGPVISEEAQLAIIAHIDHMRAAGHRIEQTALPQNAAPNAAQNAGQNAGPNAGPNVGRGTFVPPTIIEIGNVNQLSGEVFGPVLHVMRYARSDLDEVTAQINAAGYGLTFGVHSRIDAAIETVTRQARAGNIYVNRNVIGAIVGVQPFGGRGLSGTGPKAGGPLYLGRLVQNMSDIAPPLGTQTELAGPLGEENLYRTEPRGRVLLLPASSAGLAQQLADVLATGNIPLLPSRARELARGADDSLLAKLQWCDDWRLEEFDHVLIEDDGSDITGQLVGIATQDGPIPIVQLGNGETPYRRDWMVEEISISTDTTAAGGNASLMALV